MSFFLFCVPGLIFGGTEVSDSIFMFTTPGHVFGGAEGVGSRFHVFSYPDSFLAVRRVLGPVSMFCVRSDSFSAISRASGPVFMFCDPEHVFGSTEGVGFRFHVLRSRTHFRRYRGCIFPFSCFAIPDTFSAVRRATGLDLTFCATRLISGGTEGVDSRFHVLCARICYRRYRGIRVPFSCFTRPDSYSMVSMASGPVFMFCAPGHVFRRYRGRQVQFSCLGS
jgi:hypothetical protein